MARSDNVSSESTSELTKTFFNNYYNTTLSYNASEVDAVIGYFLSNVVAQILNLNRAKTSTLGYRSPAVTLLFDQRNILV